MDSDVNTTPGEFYTRSTGRGARLVAQENVPGFVCEVFAGPGAEALAREIVDLLNAKRAPKAPPPKPKKSAQGSKD